MELTHREIRGHRHPHAKNRVETAIFMPPMVFDRVKALWLESPASVSFSAFVVALLEKALEE